MYGREGGPVDLDPEVPDVLSEYESESDEWGYESPVGVDDMMDSGPD